MLLQIGYLTSLLSISFKHLIVGKFIHSNKWFHEKKSTECGKSERLRNFFNSRKEADTSTVNASAADDVSQSELLIVENEIKKINPS